jgi:RNA polymerase sigma factor (sigma-70 family)
VSIFPSVNLDNIFRLYHLNLLAALQGVVKCRHTAEDLAQESYARLANLSMSQPITHPRAFLFRTATNLALDHLRKEKIRLHRPLEEAEELPKNAPSVEQCLWDKERVIVFQHALETLSPRCREAFLLHRLHDYSYKDIATQLGITQSAVEKLMIRALAHCRAALLNYENK